jgi:hypothetical protein
VVLERDALKDHGSIIVIEDHQTALERCGAVRPDSDGECLPLGAFGRGDAIRQVGVQDGVERADAEEVERGIVAREQQTVQAYANQAGRLSLEQPAQMRGVSRGRRRAAGGHIV